MQEPRASEGRRLHPAAIAMFMADIRTLLEVVRGPGVGLVPLLLIGRWRLVLIAAVLGQFIVLPLVRYFRFRYDIREGTVVVESGAIVRRRRVIPIARIQSVDVVEKLRHRLFRVVELRVETMGGGKTEAQFAALSPAEAERIRSLLLAGGLPAPEGERPLVHLEAGDLLVAGLTGGRVAFAAALLGYVERILGDQAFSRIGGALTGAGIPTALAVAAIAGGFVAVALAISIVGSLTVYWDFTVTREGDRLVITRGLVEKRRAVVPLKRIQAVRMSENLLRRVFGLASLSLVLGGYAGRGEDRQETSMLMPVGGRAEAERVLREVSRAPDRPIPPLHPLPVRAVWHRVLTSTMGVGAIALVTAVRMGWWALLFLPVLGLAWAAVAWSWKASGYGMAGDRVFVKGGAFVLRTTVVPVRNIQHLSLVVSPLQRLFRLGSLELAIPKAKPTMHDVDLSTAGDRFHEIGSKMTEASEQSLEVPR